MSESAFLSKGSMDSHHMGQGVVSETVWLPHRTMMHNRDQIHCSQPFYAHVQGSLQLAGQWL